MECYVQFGQAGQPMRTQRAAIEERPRDPTYRYAVNVPGYGWRKLRFANGRPFVILAGAERANVTIL